MATRKRRGRDAGGPGWIATLAGALLMVIVGFGVGFVSGAAFEEPGLFLSHLRGDTQPIALETPPAPDAGDRTPLSQQEAAGSQASGSGSGAAPAASPPPVAAPPPPAQEARRAPQAAAKAPPRAGGYVIQVGAFGSSASARRLLQQLRASGLSGYVKEESSGAAPYKVRVGPFSSRDQANAVAQRLKREKSLPTWILSRDGE